MHNLFNYLQEMTRQTMLSKQKNKTKKKNYPNCETPVQRHFGFMGKDI